MSFRIIIHPGKKKSGQPDGHPLFKNVKKKYPVKDELTSALLNGNLQYRLLF